MILNGLGFVSAPLYMFSKFFEGIATEHLLGTGIKAEHITDDRLGNVLDALQEKGLSEIFLSISLKAIENIKSISGQHIWIQAPFMWMENMRTKKMGA
jgi:transposase